MEGQWPLPVSACFVFFQTLYSSFYAFLWVSSSSPMSSISSSKVMTPGFASVTQASLLTQPHTPACLHWTLLLVSLSPPKSPGPKRNSNSCSSSSLIFPFWRNDRFLREKTVHHLRLLYQPSSQVGPGSSSVHLRYTLLSLFPLPLCWFSFLAFLTWPVLASELVFLPLVWFPFGLRHHCQSKLSFLPNVFTQMAICYACLILKIVA